MATVALKERYLHFLEVIYQQILAAFIILVLWEVFKNFKANNVHTWHMVLCTLGVGLLITEGLLLFNKDNWLLKDVDRVTKGKIHAGVMFLACACITAGIALRTYQTNQDGGKHFATTHSRLGLSSWILILLAVLEGIPTGKPKLFSRLAPPIWLKGIHYVLGIVSYIMGAVTLGYGLNYLEFFTGYDGRIALLVFLVCFISYSLVAPIVALVNLFRR